MESVTYSLCCDECGEEVAVYKGETGRNAFSRGEEHLDYLEASDETSLCSGSIVSIITRADRVSNTA